MQIHKKCDIVNNHGSYELFLSVDLLLIYLTN